MRIRWPRKRHVSPIVPTVPTERLRGNPIIRPEMLPGDDGTNINGPSLIRAPSWLPGRLGDYYLYFAHHSGTYIRLAYSNQLDGPWTIYRPGTLKLPEVAFCCGHIASPDVHVDDDARQIRMYFHGIVRGLGTQKSYLATSHDGIHFNASSTILGNFYLRCLKYRYNWIAMAKGGVLYTSNDGFRDFARTPSAAFDLRDEAANSPGSVRHVALDQIGDNLIIYYTRIGDAPERILRSYIDLTTPIPAWRAAGEELVLSPMMEWEGADQPPRRSLAGPASLRECAVRDPAIFSEGGKKYLLYSVAGEGGIGIAALTEYQKG